MSIKFQIYNTLSRKKEIFEPLTPPFVGMYVCGPTVYGDAHLGHARPAITFDVLFRYLKYMKYNVRYVRNITDVGHLENDEDAGEDKIAKKARLEKLEPMEVAQHYINNYHENLRQLNILPPSIEPLASGHIPEQIELVKRILDNGFAYISEGSVYFDVEKYSKKHNYGELSGRVLEELQGTVRNLSGQSEKKSNFDFALWKKASPEHIMRWKSEWSDGFPGWHLECTAMGTKYLGETFDIHGGGLDLQFPHHECEIAQSKAALGKASVKYWMHNNMITIEGQKMGKSLGNFITLDELFSGKHKLLEQAYNPQVIKFFILQAHYRSPLDFSNSALQASEKGMMRLFKGIKTLNTLKTSAKSGFNFEELEKNCFDALNDDLNTPILISHLFDGIRIINSISDGKETINESDLNKIKKLYNDSVFDILGLKDENSANENSNNKMSEVMNILLNIRTEAKKNKNFELSDKIRNELTSTGITIKDKKDGCDWEIG